MQNYLDELNTEQRKAVTETEGPVLTIAGAGVGKTKAITYRILHLIKNGVSPDSILAITFTNKAAKEMLERVGKLLTRDKELNRPVSEFPSSSPYPTSQDIAQRDNLSGFAGSRTVRQLSNYPWIGTFHSLGVKILRENYKEAGIPASFAIFDRGDSIRSIREAMGNCGIDPKNFEPGKILSVISREKGNMVRAHEFAENFDKSYFRKMVASIWIEYEKILTNEKGLDFDDLILKTAILLKENQSVREKYQNQWKYIHVDEYQDTNVVQYHITRMLVGKDRNIFVVGDGDQCLPGNTLIETAGGKKEISKIKSSEKILGAGGDGEIYISAVKRVIKNKYLGEIINIETKSGKKISLTPNHIIFAKLTLSENKFYVYLMYRRDKGFRIGQAKSIRSNSNGEKAVGLLVRCNQEKADKIWVLKICDSKREASFWEVYYSSKYGIPTIVFLTCGRKLAIEQGDINKIFKEINTEERAEKLFEETGLYLDYPHYLPQGTTRNNSERDRININLYMFGDRRKSILHPWGMSRVSINTTDIDLKNKLQSSGFKTRKGKRGDWRLEIMRLDYGEVEKIAEKIKTLKPNLTIVRSIFVTKNKKMFFHPASNIITGMIIATIKKNEIIEDVVSKVKIEKYSGNVYDLNIDKIHNYIANGVVVHNSIYGWRGANIKNILNFEKDYPEAKIITLEENYRSTKTILSVANRIIEKNKIRKPKNLFTKNTEGERISIYTAYDENDEANFIAERSRELIKAGIKPSEIAVLYRANFQSRAIEEAFMNKGLPYQVLGTKFFERKEIKDATAYIRASINEDSFADWRRIVSAPPRGIGKVALAKIISGMIDKLSPQAKKSLSELKNILKSIKQKIESDKFSLALKHATESSGLIESFKGEGSEGEERIENLKELVAFATRYDGEKGVEGAEHFLTDIALASDQDEMDEKKEAVRLMTVHASKGLEFEVVFISGLEEDLFPHKKISENEISDEESEEERRLFYVALTRAKKKIYLSYAGIRTIFGGRQVNIPSEFILEIDEEFIANEEPVANGGKIIYLD